jgi:hypothetical protein
MNEPIGEHATKLDRDAILDWLRECEARHLENVNNGKHVRASRHHADACNHIAAAIERGSHLDPRHD